MLHIQRRHIDIEADGAHLVLRQRGLHRLAVVGGAQVAGDQHHEQRAVDGVLRPAVRRGLEVVAQVFALLACADDIQHTAAHRVLGGVAGVAHLRERTDITAACTGDHLAPVGMVSLGKLREQPHQGAAGRVLHLVGQLDAIRLLPAAEKHLGAADDLAEQALEAVLGNRQMGFDGLAGLDGLGPTRHAMGIQRFLGGEQGGNGLLQLLMVLARQVAEEQGAVDAGRAGVVQY